ncbi:hypothetical protein Q428_08975 [Fervidicella metallireducens AeB]|uniref:Uncharacterized protein n=1 Tax=Fervidicella metallireducens AeB TaxID=1403537 RepID=A0A017RWD5_9CLOT|nr:hypothetical protein Q428_08975 [Fervidicella metallireducens AeB]
MCLYPNQKLKGGGCKLKVYFQQATFKRKNSKRCSYERNIIS